MASTPVHRTGPASTLPDVLAERAARQPDEVAYVFLRDGEVPADSATYAEMHAAARARAAAFAAAGLAGRTAVMLYPSGLEFVRTLLGTMCAGVTGAPAQVPRRRQGLTRLRRIADDAGTTTVLTTAAVKRDLADRFGDLPELAGLTFVATDTGLAADTRFGTGALDGTPTPEPARPTPDDIAMLQYTSGSTGDPKGVMITHRNFIENAVETDALWQCGSDSVFVSWLPLFHDMGMLFGIVIPLWSGRPAYLMAPDAFIRRPARWPEAISKYGGTHAAAPSFAYDLCVRAHKSAATGDVGDLSRWRVAANGAEPVRWHTVRAFTEAFAPNGFHPRAMSAGYGLAENTLKATGSGPCQEPSPLWVSAAALSLGRVEQVDPETDGATVLVGAGVPVLGTTIEIVDPLTANRRAPGEVGEIWISGPCVAAGYHGRPALSEETFRARLADAPGDSRTFLRTGDLGFLHRGELFVAGRLKDVIIRKGRNFYPQDVELSAESVADGLHPNCAAAFSVDDGVAERLVVAVEADGRVLRAVGADELRDRVRDVVAENHGLVPDDVLVLRRGALPKTSSGKIQRRAALARYESGELSDVSASRPVGAGDRT
jgi:acyl-CoA synthetase (AMP-forming)/AMP-acid ligase II